MHMRVRIVILENAEVVGLRYESCILTTMLRLLLYLIHIFLGIYHFFLEILRTLTGIFLRVLRSECSFSDGGMLLS